jgi:hypothetical protein
VHLSKWPDGGVARRLPPAIAAETMTLLARSQSRAESLRFGCSMLSAAASTSPSRWAMGPTRVSAAPLTSSCSVRSSLDGEPEWMPNHNQG